MRRPACACDSVHRFPRAAADGPRRAPRDGLAVSLPRERIPDTPAAVPLPKPIQSFGPSRAESAEKSPRPAKHGRPRTAYSPIRAIRSFMSSQTSRFAAGFRSR